VTDIPAQSTSKEADAFLSPWHIDAHELLAVRGARADPVESMAIASQAVPATADINTYASFPQPVVGALDLPGNVEDWRALVLFSAHIDIAVNNADTAVALNFSGATNIPAGSQPENRLHVVAKSPISVTLSLARVVTVAAGATTVEIMHAGAACTIEDISLECVPLALLS
jgi:hypothetical protein